MERRLAVALHGVEPATYERCALIRDWLSDLGVDRATLLVTPAPDLHPFDRRSPDLADWLAERRSEGDAIAQHGLAGTPLARLGRADARRAVDSGRRLLHLAGVEPTGFVAPAYAYTPALHAALARSYDWWAALREVHRRAVAEPLAASAVTLGRLVSPLRWRARSALAGDVLRLDVHPGDVAGGRTVPALERVPVRARQDREPVTYDAL